MMIAAMITNAAREFKEFVAAAWNECPNCKYHIYNGDVSSQWPGLPAGVKFDPTDQELLVHLEGQVGRAAPHALIDSFIPTIEEVEGICYTHPENLPGIKMDGSSVHFFHRMSNAYDVGQRKGRKISKNNHSDSDGNMGWHKTGKSKPILDNGVIKGWKKILVLHKSDQGKRHRTNWMMHECHLGVEKDEKHGDLVVSKVFWQVKNNIGKSHMPAADVESGSSAAEIDPTTPNMYHPQSRRLSGSPLETEQNQMPAADAESGSSAVKIDPTTPNMYPPQPSRLIDSPLETEQNQIVHDDVVLEVLREFLNNDSILFCGAAIDNDIAKLDHYGIDILWAVDLQREIRNLTANPLPFLYDMANAYIGKNLSSKDLEIEALRWDGWADFPLKFNKIKYAALGARLGFELVRWC